MMDDNSSPVSAETSVTPPQSPASPSPAEEVPNQTSLLPDNAVQNLAERYNATLYSRHIVVTNYTTEYQRLKNLLPACTNNTEIISIQTKMHELNSHCGNLIQRHDLELASLQQSSVFPNMPNSGMHVRQVFPGATSIRVRQPYAVTPSLLGQPVSVPSGFLGQPVHVASYLGQPIQQKTESAVMSTTDINMIKASEDDEQYDSDDFSLFSESTCDGSISSDNRGGEETGAINQILREKKFFGQDTESDGMEPSVEGSAAKKKKNRNRRRQNKEQDSQIEKDSSEGVERFYYNNQTEKSSNSKKRENVETKQSGPSVKGSKTQSEKSVSGKSAETCKPAWSKIEASSSSSPGGASACFRRLQSEEYPDLRGAASMSKRDIKTKIEDKKVQFKEKPLGKQTEPQQSVIPKTMKTSQRQKKTSMPVVRLSRMASVNTINDEASLYINSAAEKGMLVTVHGAVEHILARFGVQSLAQLGINRITDISCLKKLSFVQSRVSAYLDAYTSIQAIGTLHDLGKDLARDCDKTDFDELYLGPLIKQPKVKDLFSFPQDVEKVPNIRVSDVLIHLKKYMEINKLSNQKIDLKKFLEYLQEEYGVSSPWELGIRINSIALGISVISKVRRNQYSEMDRAQERFMIDLTAQFEKEMRKIKNQLDHSMGLQKDPSLLSVTMTKKKKVPTASLR